VPNGGVPQHQVLHDSRSLHVWINEGGRWRLVFNQLTPVE